MHRAVVELGHEFRVLLIKINIYMYMFLKMTLCSSRNPVHEMSSTEEFHWLQQTASHLNGHPIRPPVFLFASLLMSKEYRARHLRLSRAPSMFRSNFMVFSAWLTTLKIALIWRSAVGCFFAELSLPLLFLRPRYPSLRPDRVRRAGPSNVCWTTTNPNCSLVPIQSSERLTSTSGDHWFLNICSNELSMFVLVCRFT